ncbi:Coagulation factor X isoform 1, partial [Araneus ventricosus]
MQESRSALFFTMQTLHWTVLRKSNAESEEGDAPAPIDMVDEQLECKDIEFYGTDSIAGEYPWMVFLFINDTSVTCGGVLINHRTVLTAAHCLENAAYCTLYFGKYNRSDENDDNEVQTRTSSEIIIHPEFNPLTFDNDIAIVKLSSDVQYSSRIHPICMPSPDSTRINVVPGQMGY